MDVCFVDMTHCKGRKCKGEMGHTGINRSKYTRNNSEGKKTQEYKHATQNPNTGGTHMVSDHDIGKW